MKKIVTVYLLFVMCLSFFPGSISAAEPPQIDSPAAILIDFYSGEVLFEKEADTRMYPASTTKIMTALLALENGNLDDVVTASQKAVNSIEIGSSNMGLLAGEQMTLRDLLYGLLVNSANEAANVIAEYVSGDIDKFVELMNKRAKELGAQNTNFMNPNGLHDDNHYTTARDMAKIAQFAMTNETFREIVKTTYIQLPPTEKYRTPRDLNTTNHLLLRSSAYYYSPAIGIKTGYTEKAKNCLVSAATVNGMEMISVVYGASVIDGKNLSFAESKKLFEYGFSNYAMRQVISDGELLDEQPLKQAKGAKFIKLEASGDTVALLPADVDVANQVTRKNIPNEKITAPIKKGDVLGKTDFYYQDKVIASVNMVADKDYAYSRFSVITDFFKAIFTSKWLYIVLGAIVVYILIVRQIRYNRRKKRRVNRNRYSGRL